MFLKNLSQEVQVSKLEPRTSIIHYRGTGLIFCSKQNNTVTTIGLFTT